MSSDIVTAVISGLPNLAVAIWCIWNYQKTIDKLIDQENKLLDQLLVRLPLARALICSLLTRTKQID